MRADSRPDIGCNEQKVEDPPILSNFTDDQKAELAYRILCRLPLFRARQIVNRLQPILNRDYLSNLPREIALDILYCLDVPSLKHMSQTSKYWLHTCQDQALWKDIFFKQHWTVNQVAIEKYLSHREPRKCHGTMNHPVVASSAASLSPLDTSESTLTRMCIHAHFKNSSTEQSKQKEVVSRVIVERFSNKPLSNRRYPWIYSEAAYFHYDDVEDKRFINWARLYYNRSKIARRWRNVQCNMRIFPPPPPHYIAGPTGTAPTIVSLLPIPFRNRDDGSNLLGLADESIQAVQHNSESNGIYCLQFNDNIMMTGSRDRCISIWSVRSGRLKQRLHGHLGSVLCLQFDSQYVISGSSDSQLMVWSIVTGKHIKTLTGHTESVLNVRFKDNFVVSCSKDKTLRTWDWKKDDKRETDTASSSNSKHGGTTLMVFRGHRAAVNALQFRGDRIVSASGDRTIKIWDMHTGQCLRTLDSHSRGIACVEYDGEYIVSGSSDQTIRVWNAFTGECLRVLSGHTDLVRTLQMNPSAKTIVSGSYDGTVRIWNLEDGKLIKTLSQTTHGRILNLQFDFTKIICCTNFGSIVIYDFAYGIDTQFLES